METELDTLAPSKATAAKTVYATFKILKAAGGQLPGREVVQKLRERLTFSEWEKGIYESNNTERWIVILQFYTIDCIKAGFMKKEKRVWYLTEEGEKAISLGQEELLNAASAAYREWAVNRGNHKPK